MQVLHNSRVGDFTRGGQVTIHFLRMIWQVVHQFFAAIVVLYVVMTIGLWWTISSPYDRYLAFRYCGANAGVLIGNGDNATYVRTPRDEYVQTTIRQVANSPVLLQRTATVGKQWMTSMGISMGIGVALVLLVMAWLLRFGASQRKEEKVRGEGIASPQELSDMLKSQRAASTIKLAGIPIIENTETQHFLMTGSPGSGKTTAILDLMTQIRARGERCICYSPSGDFIERFYREGDTILNPFDARCPGWNMWSECRQDYDYAMVAGSIIPEPAGKENAFWATTARQVMTAVSQKMGRPGQPTPTTQQLLHYMLTAPQDELQAYLADTYAATLASKDMANTAAGIRATVTSYVESLKYIPVGPKEFSIREWVDNGKGKDWVFLNARSSQLQAVRPVLSMWLQVFANCLKDLSSDRNRRIWLIVDEVASLQKVSALADFVAQTRKNGGCAVIAFQQLPQLSEIYGKDGALALIGNVSTWLCMRQNDPETAKHISEKLGETEVMENTQGISYGANTMRDGVNLNSQRKNRTTVTPTEIMQLNNLEGYLRLPGKYPTAHFVMKRREMKIVAPAFVQGTVVASADPLPDMAPGPAKPAVETAAAATTEAAAKVEPATVEGTAKTDTVGTDAKAAELGSETVAASEKAPAEVAAGTAPEGSHANTEAAEPVAAEQLPLIPKAPAASSDFNRF